MATVYLAEREGEFTKRVAVKLIRGGMESPEVIRRFLVERQTLAALNHPYIVSLLDGGTTEDGLPYLVVEYVDGLPIDVYCQRNHLGERAKIELMLKVCDAIHTAHRALIVHCDLKPPNILVTQDGSPRLLDFGVAKLLDPASVGVSGDAAKTRMRAFTPDYASPEQLCGEPVTTSTDVYALGVVLYEILAGKLPYEVKTDGSLVDMIRSITEIKSVPPLQKGRESELDAIVGKALKRDPAERYASVDQLASDLRRYLEGRPILARRNTTGYVIRKFVHRHWRLVGAGAAAAAAIVASAGIALWEAKLAKEQGERAQRLFAELRVLARAVLYEVHDSIVTVPGTTTARALIAERGAEYLNKLARDAGGDADLWIDLANGYRRVGDVRGNPYESNLGDTKAAMEMYTQSVAAGRRAVELRPASAEAREALAHGLEARAGMATFRSNPSEGLPDIEESIRLREKNSGAESRLRLASSWEIKGDLLAPTDPKAAQAAYQRALALAAETGSNQVQSVRMRAVLTNKAADMQYAAGDKRGSMATYQEASRLAAALAGLEPNNVRHLQLQVIVWNNIAWMHGEFGEFADAERTYMKARAADERMLKEDPASVKAKASYAVTRKNLANLYRLNKREADARREYAEVERVLRELLALDPANPVWQKRLEEVREETSSAGSGSR